MLTNPAVLNALIIGVLGIVTLLLNRRFSRRDTITSTMVTELRRLRVEQNWQRRVINVLDSEVWEARRVMAAAGMALGPRPEWPRRPEEDDDLVDAK